MSNINGIGIEIKMYCVVTVNVVLIFVHAFILFLENIPDILS
jgi:hypothetical protein